MPLYEYECADCHRRTEKIQKFSDPELTTCPFCSGPLARTLTAPAIQFKGSGWYKDLYSSPKPPAASGSGEGAATPGAASEGSATSKSDSSSKADSSSRSDSTASAASASKPAAAPSSTGTSSS
ncbi:MAG: FmdB family zinc ribbon protein [Janthinobacterium lividum]